MKINIFAKQFPQKIKQIHSKDGFSNTSNYLHQGNKENIYSVGFIKKAWIDIKRNYCVKDFETNGAKKQNKLLKNKLFKSIFDFAELKLKNFHKVSDKYLRGGAISCEYDITRLEEMGVSDIVNLLEPQKQKMELANFARKQKINYHNFFLSEVGTPSDTQINEFLNIIKHAQGAVYVHCLHGKDRTGIMSLIYETEILKTPVNKAFKTMLNIGMNAKKNPKMIEFLINKYPNLKSFLD